MNALVPSRRVLRHLASLCDASRPASSKTLRSSRRSCTTPRQPQHLYTQLSLSGNSPRSRSFTSISTRHQSQETPAKLPDISNNYTIFPHTLPSGPPPSGPFAIAIPSLRREFLQLQSQWHPDKFAEDTGHGKAVALSTRINEAYKTLSDPLLRAQYLLLHNYDIDVMSEDNSSHPTDQQTLMEVMETQELIEEATDAVQIERLLEDNYLRVEETTEKMAKAFEAGDTEAARNECVRLKYWRSLQDGLKDWEPGKVVRLIH